LVTDRRLHVYLDGLFCGSLLQSAVGALSFRYDEDYRADAEATPLSLSMPLSTQVHKQRVVLPWLQGLLPDSDEALSAMGRRWGVSPRNPFALLEHVGADAAGAVQIIAPDTLSTDARGRGDVRPVAEYEVAEMLANVINEYVNGIPDYDSAGRFSLAGAQPKIALHRLPDGTWGVPDEGTPTTHILKPVVGTFRRIDVVEQLTLRAAAHLGNAVAPADLVRIGEWHVLVSERYDRRFEAGTWHRLHQEDLCQALSVSPAKKYQHRDGGPGIADIATVIRALPLTTDRASVGAAFYRAFVFNVVAGCTDAHAKNYSLMLEGRSVRLAPLYDLLTYAGYWDGKARIDSAMSVDGEYAFNKISAKALIRAGARFGLSSETAEEIVLAARRGMLDAFDAARRSISQYGDDALAVADDVMRGVRQLALVLA
jgi:serine/threonine-protein kinase HipA